MPNRAEPDKLPDVALQDTVRYQEHLFRLMLHHDDRALRVLSIYGAIIGALLTAGFALNQAKALGLYTLIFMVATGGTLAIGCAFAAYAGWSADIFLPGRKPDFWKWALENRQNVRSTVTAYVDQAAESIAQNERIANAAAKSLGRSYLCGVLAPLVGVIVPFLAYAARTFIP